MKNVYPVLNKNVLLIIQPEGGIVGILGAPCEYINDIAVEILELCDGKHTIATISDILAEKHDEQAKRAFELVLQFVESAVQKGHVYYASEPTEIAGTITGKKDYTVPMDVSVDITLRCDLKCIHCYSHAGSQKDVLSTQEWLEILHKIHQAGVTKLVLTGGDPPASPDFMKILQFCAKNFFIVDIATNGYRINDELARNIAEMEKIGVITSRLSIDGTKKTHDAIRGVSGSWEKAVQAVRHLSRWGIPVSVTMTLNPQNLNDVEDVIVTAKANGASRFSAGMTLKKGRAYGKNLEITASQKKEVAENLEQLAQKHSTPTFKVSTWIKLFDRDVPDKKSVNCGAGYRMYSINDKGDVKPCPSLDYYMGNLVEQSPEEIFTSPLVDFFTQLEWPTRELCGDCEHFHICTECHAAALIKSRDVEKCPWADQWVKVPKGFESPV